MSKMDVDAFIQEMGRTSRQYCVEVVSTPEQLREAYHLRYLVYCLERSFESPQDDMEIDMFDNHARHVLLRDTDDGLVVGTVRVVLSNVNNLHDSFPMQLLCETTFLVDIPLLTTGEISRLALSKQRRGPGRSNDTLLRLLLWRGILEISMTERLTHWLAVAEPSNIRLHARHSIHLDPVGPMILHRGRRQPMVGVIDNVLRKTRSESFPVWDFITDGGRLYGS
jgi:N-acyl-L-homoserine lactone synthetase